ncbi:deacetylase [Paenibacillus albilobatus]|uniref:Deacetylase n=3 Tax=Paenibacillus TaxID=44249 RepID=A0A920C8A6_9BACL|nr:deacetylase [Paenibacillus albilobatus]
MHKMHIFLLLLVILTGGTEKKADYAFHAQIEKKLSAPKTNLSLRANAEAIPILMYHSISQNRHGKLFVSPEVFYQQMEHLNHAGYHTITFKDLLHWKTGEALPDKPVLITFDDGYLDNYKVAYPILKAFQMKATIFVTSDFIGSPNHLNWSQIREMEQSGFIEIGAHTRHHVELTKSKKLQRVDEVLGGKRRLEKGLGHPVIAFAYPSGKYNQNVVQVVKRAGFEFAVTTKPGYAAKRQGYLTLHRVRIGGEQSVAEFIRKIP